jgi:tight adherence protein B
MYKILLVLFISIFIFSCLLIVKFLAENSNFKSFCRNREPMLIRLTIIYALIVLLLQKIIPIYYALLITLPLTYSLWKIWQKIIAERHQKAYRKQLPEVLDFLSRFIHAGLPLTHALTQIEEEIGAPFKQQFLKINHDLHLGTPFGEAIKARANDVNLKEFNLLTEALILQQSTGGNLRYIIDNLSLTIRKRLQLALKIKAISADARFSSLLLSLLPIVITGAIAFFNPGYIADFIEDPRGQVLGFIAIGFWLTGIILVRRLTKIEKMS